MTKTDGSLRTPAYSTQAFFFARYVLQEWVKEARQSGTASGAGAGVRLGIV